LALNLHREATQLQLTHTRRISSQLNHFGIASHVIFGPFCNRTPHPDQITIQNVSAKEPSLASEIQHKSMHYQHFTK